VSSFFAENLDFPFYADESFLFLLTSDTDPGIGLPGDGVGGLVKAAALVVMLIVGLHLPGLV
jgi:hypothetical protein